MIKHLKVINKIAAPSQEWKNSEVYLIYLSLLDPVICVSPQLKGFDAKAGTGMSSDQQGHSTSGRGITLG